MVQRERRSMDNHRWAVCEIFRKCSGRVMELQFILEDFRAVDAFGIDQSRQLPALKGNRAERKRTAKTEHIIYCC